MKILSGINKVNVLIDRKRFVRRMVKIVGTIIIIMLAFILVLLGIVLVNSPGKLEPFLDKEGSILQGSISEKVFLQIGGVKQGMFIRGKNINNPVLLFIHGGPCFPEYFLVDKYQTSLEDKFTVCYWEQRGGGISYSSDVSLESMTMEKLKSDALEVTNYLRKRFDKEQIYLMAHSGGTAFAIQLAAESPELYQAYIGIAQITNQFESEKLAYSYLMEQYKKSGNSKMIKKLEEYPVTEHNSYIIPFFKSIVRDKAMHELGVGTMRDMKSVEIDAVQPIMLCKAYTFGEKINLWTSKFSFVKKTKLIDELFAADLKAKVQKFDIPVYFFSGKYDLTVNHDLSKEYLHNISAPLKGFYTFDNSAHSPIFEEPEKMMQIIEEDVLKSKTSLADND